MAPAAGLMLRVRNKAFLKPWDGLIILLALSMTAFSALSYIKPAGALRVLIQGRNRQWIFPLDADETIAVSGPLGNTTVKIRDGYAWVESSPCGNQVCVARGRIHRRGVWTACLPNNVFLMIEGYDDEEPIDSAVW